MEPPIEVIDSYLKPGEIFFGDHHHRVRTLLGSCVSIVLWHPKYHFGGMCHYLLPYPSDIKLEKTYKYGEEAFQYFINEIKKAHTKPEDYLAKIFGGSNMFLNEEREILRNNATSLIGTRNAEFAKKVLSEHKIKIISEDIGGNQSRKIYFSIWDGEVWVEKK